MAEPAAILDATVSVSDRPDGDKIAIALAACYLPARRASLIDPIVTLRSE